MLKKSKLIVGVAIIASSTNFSIAEEMTKLVPEFPKPLFAGTPKTIKSPNLERPNEKRADIMVPKGTTNIAKGASVTSSDDFPIIGELEFITDGDKDGSEGCYVELGPGTQWIKIDLGAQKTIYAIAVWHYHAQARAYRDVIIQIADDEDFTKNMKTIFNNDNDNSIGKGIGKDKEYIETNKGRIVDAKGAKGRYVRFYSAGSTSSDMNHYIEVEIFGK